MDTIRNVFLHVPHRSLIQKLRWIFFKLNRLENTTVVGNLSSLFCSPCSFIKQPETIPINTHTHMHVHTPHILRETHCFSLLGEIGTSTLVRIP